jgi:hypothetical protein
MCARRLLETQEAPFASEVLHDVSRLDRRFPLERSVPSASPRLTQPHHAGVLGWSSFSTDTAPWTPRRVHAGPFVDLSAVLQIGYCQAMVYPCMLIATVVKTEQVRGVGNCALARRPSSRSPEAAQDAFNVFAHFMQGNVPAEPHARCALLTRACAMVPMPAFSVRSLYAPGLPGLSLCLFQVGGCLSCVGGQRPARRTQFEKLVRAFFPDFSQHLAVNKVRPSMFATVTVRYAIRRSDN